MLIRVIRFFVTVLLAVIGGVILHLASPVLTELISTEVLKTEMGLYKLTMANVILIGIGLIRQPQIRNQLLGIISVQSFCRIVQPAGIGFIHRRRCESSPTACHDHGSG